MPELRVTRAQLRQGVKLTTSELNTIIVAPEVNRLRLVGMFFDLNKCFLLPTAMHGIRKIKALYDDHPDSNVLVVGHTDTSGDNDPNLTLSLERADAVAAFLTDAVDKWEAFFDAAKPDKKRWGTREVQSMLSALPEDGTPFYPNKPNGAEDATHKAAVKAFQTDQGLDDDGIAGPDTRHALIQAYMGLDETTLPDGITLTTHGCGENFPADATGDDVRDPDNRRVEVFLFDGPITPPPPASKTSAAGSPEYPAWLGTVTETIDISADDAEPDTLELRFHDADANPLTDVPFKVAISGQPDITGTAADGKATVDLPPFCPTSITISWGRTDQDGTFLFTREIIPDCVEGDEKTQARSKLSNLGYPSTADDEFDAAVRAFQADYQIKESGLKDGGLPPATNAKLNALYAGDLDASRPAPPPSDPDADTTSAA